MFARNKSKERGSTRKVTPPSPAYMSSEQFAAYLTDLRNNRVNRPGGSRPQPASGRDSAASGGRPSLGGPPLSDSSSVHNQRTLSNITRIAPSANRPSMSASVSSRYSASTSASTRGRDYYPDRPVNVQPLKPSQIVPSATYIERGQRWMEKEEAVSLRQAMEDMELQDQSSKNEHGPPAEGGDDVRLYEAALNEAAELVWQHQNPGRVPQPGAAYRYKPHLRKNSYAHARTASAGMYGGDVAPTGLAREPTSRSVSGSSTNSDGVGSTRSRSSFGSSRQAAGTSETARQSTESARNVSPEPQSAKPYAGMSGGPAALPSGRRRSSMKRNISGEVCQPFSGEQIWEEQDGQVPEGGDRSTGTDSAAVQPLRPKPKNPLNRVQFAPDVPPAAGASPQPPSKVVSKYEIYRNPPSQSRNPQYTTNSRPESPAAERDTVPRKHGMEVRSDDIRGATSMRLRDRSPKLPTPSAVSDSPGRPIKSRGLAEAAPDRRPSSLAEHRVSSNNKPKRSLLSLLRLVFRTRSHRPRPRGQQATAHSRARPLFR
ncbi:hypothetical protein B0T24DRAFT_102694 [Lasiosphaeria ovina]|uniref:Uncharacterized protein n=1 Tax=Lasiosphaeria ovina TaxID=92902 RepID=A0AAE0N053_9PEZI|nr:hypothetical protein B0T24DRAFT_102694 [Lasiosphaeria ovina]